MGGSVLFIPVFFALASLGVYTLSVNFPEHTGLHSNSSDLKFPTNMDELQSVANFLHDYKNDHFNYVMLLFTSAYLYKQTFAIPGSVFMNLLAGALYGPWVGFILCCFLISCGSSFCYLLSDFFGKKYIIQYFPQKVKYFQTLIEENLDSLFFFLLFLRLFPMSPNWFMNMASPIVNIPLHIFFLSILVGSMPYIFICVQTGCVLSQIRSLDEIFTLWTMAKLCGIAIVALLPGFLIKKHCAKQKKKE
ncbi:transmembrane protein 41A-like isoform X1 [Haliotis rufescens]|uniref:transmembrane protein 41A-like isoform X1 n=1 Tax=Haliotis rufescens TaxID=6454 RepID=UPI00201F88F4|nr:transmembrane protein 41A-like isoform X1 [Haliotis rufescens]